MVDIKEEFFGGEYDSSISDIPSVTEQLSPGRKRTRTSTSFRCPYCNAWNESDAEKCYNSLCDHVFGGKRKAQSQDVSCSDSNSECSVSQHQTCKVGQNKPCLNCGTTNSSQSVICRNKKCKHFLRKKRKGITKVSKDLKAHKESPTKVPHSAQSKNFKECSLCENPIDGSKCECSSSGTTMRQKRNTQGESREKFEGQRKSMRNLGKDELNVTTEWNEEEKELLLGAIEKYGVIDLEKLRSSVITKSKNNIWSYIIRCSKVARANLVKSASDKSSSHKAPIDEWLGIMENSQPLGYNEIKTLPIARSILYIAKYEPHPKSEDCGGIDFKSMYEVLYALLCGLPPKKLNAPTARYFAQSFEKMICASHSNKFNERVEFLKKIKSVSYTPEQFCKKYSGKKASPESDTTDVFMDLPGMNPFHVYSNLCHVEEIS